MHQIAVREDQLADAKTLGQTYLLALRGMKTLGKETRGCVSTDRPFRPAILHHDHASRRQCANGERHCERVPVRDVTRIGPGWLTGQRKVDHNQCSARRSPDPTRCTNRDWTKFRLAGAYQLAGARCRVGEHLLGWRLLSTCNAFESAARSWLFRKSRSISRLAGRNSLPTNPMAPSIRP